jgi:hypothetical protein
MAIFRVLRIYVALQQFHCIQTSEAVQAALPAPRQWQRSVSMRRARSALRGLRTLGWIALAGVVCGSATADECDLLPPPSVTLKRLAEQASVDTHYSVRELTHLGSELASPGKAVLGLTRGTALVKFTSTTRTYLDPSRRWECASPQITLSFGYSPLFVYVANEFPEGSCAYREIYQHELRHVRTYQDHLATIEKDLAATLNRRFATGSPWRGAAGQTNAQLQREFNERWLPYVKREIDRVSSAQALIDSPEEYARVTASCNGEIARRLR